jgi:hypothetical protein
MKNVRFAFRKLMKVGRSTETVRLNSSISLSPSMSLPSETSVSFTCVNSTPQLDFVVSSAKSVEKPTMLRFSYSSVRSPIEAHTKLRRPNCPLPPALRLEFVLRACAARPDTKEQYCGWR